jgi:two-component sensor histidine kinase
MFLSNTSALKPKKILSLKLRQDRDAEANRFTRHEVKNGLLAAIGLCDSLSETAAGEQKKELFLGEITSSVIELDKTLREILDTVLSEAMARDIISEIYQPQLERVDFNEVLSMKGNVSDAMSAKGPRFSVITYPSPLPMFFFDQQLLRFIHHNAVSNACKYGKKGGAVQTVVHFDALQQRIQMNVINLPGSGHEEILKLGSEAKEIVFHAGQRLHIHKAEGSEQSGVMTHSAGDGAWIMRKCAKTLGGECMISFNDMGTVFSLSCPATPFDVATKLYTSINTTNFLLPQRTWGIAIDDSKIQRSFLKKVFRMIGISKERIFILGKNAEEIRGFADFVVEFVDLHSEDYFFVIVDENLHLGADSVELRISGSLCIQLIRDRLIPEHERRILSVVRSANDSAHDVAIFNSRAHGFFPKTITKKEGVMDLVALLWGKRFER